jgi:hypothetical protein
LWHIFTFIDWNILFFCKGLILQKNKIKILHFAKKRLRACGNCAKRHLFTTSKQTEF